jgi:hypothetical protein
VRVPNHRVGGVDRLVGDQARRPNSASQNRPPRRRKNSQRRTYRGAGTSASSSCSDAADDRNAAPSLSEAAFGDAERTLGDVLIKAMRSTQKRSIQRFG